MPYLSPDDRKILLGEQPTCNGCGQKPIKSYCRSCDEFFISCECTKKQTVFAAMSDAKDPTHAGHRIYDGAAVARGDLLMGGIREDFRLREQ